MLKLSRFYYNHRPSGEKILAKFIRHGIWVVIKLLLIEYSGGQ